ncbi:hypothetical protein GCM10009527_045670 [Actinomadura nitritigenes]|uniref:Uncharacterized protein n=1 Tax=Actinomadura nitritigenes TaxID=134602 RepID=A0ABS3R9R6_9ACTN|nr:hypothetical protein [Actinomadura nitritigenes]MBO2442388.1 hypothetical protein [Actinomadura nitritigenes]
MNNNPVRAALFALTILYGLLIALLAVLDTPALGLVAAIGGVLLGLGWAFSGRFTRGRA